MQAFLLVGIGGALGAMARYGFGLAVGSLANGFPSSTFLINIIGSIAMGLLVGSLARATPQFQNEIRLLVAVGILGGFTTFSSFSLDAVVLLERGDFLLAGVYIVGSAFFSIVGLMMGLWVMRVAT